MSNSRPKLVTLFRYSILEQDAMVNTYPRVVADLAKSMEIHRFSFRSLQRHWLHDEPHVHFHEIPFVLRRGMELDKWIKTCFWVVLAPLIGLWSRWKKVDLINVEETLPAVALMVKWISGRPVILTGPDVFWDVYLPERGLWSQLRPPAAALHRFMLRQVDYFITHTDSSKAFIGELGIGPECIRVVREACEENVFHRDDRQTAREVCGYKPGDIVLFHHGIMNPSKALDRILRWLPPLFEENPALRFVIAGDGATRQTLESLSDELGIADRVSFLGWLPRVGDLAQLLNACDISLVMRSGRFSDHFHITANLFHSLTCGCCTLAANLQGIRELVREDENGLLFEPNDEEAFQLQVKRLTDDPALRQRLGKAAHHTAQTKLNPEQVKKDWATAIQDFMEKSLSKKKGSTKKNQAN